jgi:deoxycytidylate deaminase
MLSRKDVAFLNIARYFAEKSQEKKKHGAVVVKSGRVVGTGFNKYKNHPNNIPEDLVKIHCSRHAEQIAIKEAGTHCRGAVLYIARVNRQGLDRNSTPCFVCEKLIKLSGIKKVIYTMEEPCH